MFKFLLEMVLKKILELKSNESLMTSEFSKDLDDEMRIVTNSLKNTLVQS